MDRLERLARSRARRLRDSGLPVLQCALAAGLAYLVARDVVGHPVPFFAPIACVLVLGVSLTNRLRRSVELALGVSVGVAVGDLIVVLIGPGWWQISVVVGLALLAALLFDVGALLLNQAAVSAVLVATLQPPGTTGAFTRWIDTLIGAAIGLATAATLPSHPLTRARRGLAALLTELEEVLIGTADALRTADPEAAAAVLERARATQGRVDALADAVDAGFEITAIAPLRRRHRGELARLRVAVRAVDLALRNARVLARRGHAAIRDGEETGADVVAVLRTLAEDTATLRRELTTGESTDGARSALLDTVGAVPARGGGYSADVVIAQIRSMLVDLLTAAGMDRDEAVAATTSTRLGDDGPTPS
ncbi:FUSC family protein [Actinomycetospora lutea]|uniref:FUSC family protein n=1 Tax=Actinomycetospora lutea TaxID=663604 RepID=UPI00236667CB|nr:FUSC family protein [Actinomycetospora lutea]MDD7940690.1 FUSC family protein [Actinomycetospora lutea]